MDQISILKNLIFFVKIFKNNILNTIFKNDEILILLHWEPENVEKEDDF